jgi:hypothetical protein
MSVDRDNAGRPSVLDTASETQIEELERQFSEGDRQAWDILTQSYGWSSDQGRAVWEWFNQRPPSQQSGSQSR